MPKIMLVMLSLNVYHDKIYRMAKSQRIRDVQGSTHWLGTFPEWAPISIVEVDNKLKITYINPTATYNFRDIYDGNHPVIEDLGVYYTRLKQQKNKTVTRELKIGQRFFLQYISIIEDYDVMRLYCIDITELKLLRDMAIKDELTGLFNRRGLLELAKEHYEAALAAKEHFIILYADLDNLKKINDEYGHHAGDLALKSAAGVLKTVFRDYDIVSRFGGDEFLVLAVDKGPEDFASIQALIESAFAKFNQKSNLEFDLSLSLGLSSFNHNNPMGFEELVQAADSKLYQRKRSR